MSSSSRPDSYEAYKLQKRILNFFGFWQEHKDNFTNFRRFISTSIILAYLIIEYIVLFGFLDDLGLFFDHLCCLITPSVLICKLAVLEYRKENFRALLRCLLDRSFKERPKSLDIYVERSLREMKIFREAFLWLSMVVIGQMIVTPFLKGEKLPLPVPFEVGAFRWVMFGWQVVAFFTIALGNISLDLFIISMMSLGVAQLEILGEKILMIGDGFGNTYEAEFEGTTLTVADYDEEEVFRMIFQERVVADLKKCVEHHHAIKRYIFCLERNFTLNFLFQYVASIVVICVSGFQVVNIPFGTFRFFMMFFFFLDMMLELGMYCWYGNKIIIMSTGVLDACYNSKWLYCSGEARKSLFIIMENSKIPLKLTAGGFFTFSLGSFLAVLKSSYSYFALMQQMYKEQKGKE